MLGTYTDNHTAINIYDCTRDDIFAHIIIIIVNVSAENLTSYKVSWSHVCCIWQSIS